MVWQLVYKTGSESNSESGSKTGSETNSESGSKTGSETNSESGSKTGSETLCVSWIATHLEHFEDESGSAIAFKGIH